MRLPLLAAALLLAWPFGGGVEGQGGVAATSRSGTAGSGGPAAPVSADPEDAAMAPVPAGSFVPAFARVTDDGAAAAVSVEAFALDRTPVAVADYLDFLRAEPAWRRSAAPAVLVGPDYLEAWEGDLEPGAAAGGPERPVTGVSWFAARAYCGWRGARLPTTDEWEYAAGLGGRGPDGRATPEHTRRVRDLHATRPAADALPPVGRTFENGPGLQDLHGLVHEWTADFNDRMATGAGRDDQGLDRRLFCAAGSVDATDRSDYAAFARYSFRTGLTGAYAGRMLGFRCARTPAEGRLP